MSWTIKQPIELTITRFPGLFRFNLTHKTLTKLDEKPTRKTRAQCSFFVSSSSSLLSSHVLITLFGSPSPNLVVLLNVTKLWGIWLINLSYRWGIFKSRARMVSRSRRGWQKKCSRVWRIALGFRSFPCQLLVIKSGASGWFCKWCCTCWWAVQPGAKKMSLQQNILQQSSERFLQTLI